MSDGITERGAYDIDINKELNEEAKAHAESHPENTEDQAIAEYCRASILKKVGILEAEYSVLKEVKTTSKTGGLRFNGNKAKLSIVPPELEEAVAEVLWASAEENGGKYPLSNWKKGLPLTDTADSALRHIKAFIHKGDLDSDSGLHHLKHAATNLAFLLHFIAHAKYRELDDREKTDDRK